MKMILLPPMTMNNIMVNELAQQAQQDLKDLPDAEFVQKYKATKRFYRAISKAHDWVLEAILMLQGSNLLDVDEEVIDTANVVVDDMGTLLERMHMAAYWKGEEDDE